MFREEELCAVKKGKEEKYFLDSFIWWDQNTWITIWIQRSRALTKVSGHVIEMYQHININIAEYEASEWSAVYYLVTNAVPSLSSHQDKR